ncbi:pyridoxal phosphate-dependent aminotransferase [Anaerosporobacter sp.]|uniref:pyridoxal phosphate-dependent aminotransferase n=1 Tax=Anaerosporobacter sp. TaxID=1872529 RepID=UPI00286F3C51|nr:pyridoxal phosphate-dependent class II aminotransferase [Anaerosporobacter sp.]
MINVHGGDIYNIKVKHDFSANINPLGIPSEVLEAISTSLRDIVNYPDVNCSKLRNALSSKLHIPQQYFYIGNGAADALFTLALAKKPKTALLVSPTFAEYEQALKSVDCKISYYELQDSNGFAITEDYITALSPNLDMIILCNPNNPVGNTISHEVVLHILKRCFELNITVVVDECFNDFLKNPEYHTLLEALDRYNNLVILQAFTKMYAMPGLRLGYLMTANQQLITKMQEVSQPWSVSTLAQVAGVVAVKQEDYVSKTREYVEKEREFLCKALFDMGIRYFEPEANYILFYDAIDWYKELLEEGILIRDCSNYRGLSKGYYRIAVRTREENEVLIEVMRRIKSVRNYIGIS